MRPPLGMARTDVRAERLRVGDTLADGTTVWVVVDDGRRVAVATGPAFAVRGFDRGDRVLVLRGTR